MISLKTNLYKYTPWMFRGVLFCLFIGNLTSCQDNTRNYEKVLYTNDTVSLESRTAGLLKDVRSVYVTAFTDLTSDSQNNAELLTDNLKDQMAQMGYYMPKQINSSDIIISGRIDSFISREADRIQFTNGLILEMTITLTVQRRNKEFLIIDQNIRERLIAFNQYRQDTNKVQAILISNIAAHTAETIVYGWQWQYSQNINNIQILGTNLILSNTNKTQK